MNEECNQEDKMSVDSVDIQVSPTLGDPQSVTGCLGKFFPYGFFGEFVEICKLALPIMATSLATNTIGTVSIIFCGRLGKTELAAAGLANSIFNVTGLAVLYGLLTACDTLFSQVTCTTVRDKSSDRFLILGLLFVILVDMTFGGKSKRNMGIHLQRGMYIITCCCFACWGLHLSVRPILLAMHQNPEISRLAAEYLVYTIPALLFAAWYNVLTKYVQTQNIVIAPLVVGIIGNCTNALVHYLLLFKANTGLRGSAVAQSLSYGLEVVLILAYLYFSKAYKETWHGYKPEMWQDWHLWFKLALPGLMMLGLQWWIFEIGTILTGCVGDAELGAQTIIITIDSLIYTTIPLGLGVAACIRVGQALGAGNAIRPRSTASVTVVTVSVAVTIVSILLVTLKRSIVKIFSNDETVVGIAIEVFPLTAFFIFFDAQTGVLGGVLRGAGMQRIGAITVLLAFYLIGGPIGIGLLMATSLRVLGLWIGFLVGIVVVTLTYLVFCLRINWQDEVELALRRTKSSENDTSDEVKDSRSTIIMTRLAFTCGMLATTGLGLVVKLAIPWNQVFGSYCVFENGTFSQFSLSDTEQLKAYADANGCKITLT